MADQNQKNTPSQGKRQTQSNEQEHQEQRDESNKRRFVDQSGLEASQLPDGGRGDADTKWAKELSRNSPQQHGGEMGGDGGMRGDRDISDSDIHGGRKNN